MRTIVFLLALLCLPALAQQKETPAGMSRQNRTAEEYIQLLESERRVTGLQVDRVIDTLKVAPGQKIADVGAGSGVFSRPLARKVAPTGLVYAVDIDPELLKHVEATAREQKLGNLKTILAPETDPKIPEPVDLIVIFDTMHHIQNQPAYVKGLRKYLKKNGRVAVIDFKKEWPAGHEKMVYKLEDLDGWMKGAGFRRVEQYDFLGNDFFVVYR